MCATLIVTFIATVGFAQFDGGLKRMELPKP